MTLPCSYLEYSSDFDQAVEAGPLAGTDGERNRQDGMEFRGTKNESPLSMPDTDADNPTLRTADSERNSQDDEALGGMERETQTA